MWKGGGRRSFLANFAFLAPDLAGAHQRLTKVGQRVAMIVKTLATLAKPLTIILLLSIDPKVLLSGKIVVCVCVVAQLWVGAR